MYYCRCFHLDSSQSMIFTGSREIMPYMFIFLGGMALTISLEEILKRQTGGSLLALLAGPFIYWFHRNILLNGLKEAIQC